MKLKYLFCIMLLLFTSPGCRHTETVCEPPAAFSTLVVMPFDASSTHVEEAKYRKLPRGIASETTRQLAEQLEDSKMFNKVTRSSKCSGKAVKIEGKITKLIHKKGNFIVQTRGKFINCKTNEVIGKFENSNHDSKSDNVANKIAEEVADSYKKIVCEKH